MNMQAPLSQPASDAASRDAASDVGDFARPVLEEQLEGLRRLARIGLAIAEDIGRRSAESAERSGGADHVEVRAMKAAAIDLAFARVSRAVRLTYALQNEVLEQLRRIGNIEEADAAISARERETVSKAREQTVRSVLTRILQDEAYGPEDDNGAAPESDDGSDTGAGDDLSGEREHETYERLIGEARECLQDRDRFGDMSNRPVSDIIGLICKDLGVDPDWLSLSEESWAQEEMRSGAVGKALAKVVGQFPPALPSGSWAGEPKSSSFDKLRMRIPTEPPS